MTALVAMTNRTIGLAALATSLMTKISQPDLESTSKRDSVLYATHSGLLLMK